MPAQLQRFCKHKEPKEAEDELKDEEPDFAPSFQQFVISFLLSLDIRFGCFSLSDQKGLILCIFLVLKVDRINEDAGVGYHAIEG